MGADPAAEEGPALGQPQIFTRSREYPSAWEEGSLPGQAPVPGGNRESGFILWSHTLEGPDGSVDVPWDPEVCAGLG